MGHYKLEEFKAVGGKFRSVISLVKSGGFGISSGFTHAQDIKGITGVKLFYDKEKNAVGFKFLKEKESGMLRVKIRKDGGAYIGAKSFLANYKVNQEKFSGRYEPKEIMDENFGKVFMVDLKQHE